MDTLRRLTKLFPAFFTAFILALAVWISAVTSNDPTEERIYPQPVPIEVIGQDAALVLTSDIPDTLNLTLSAPRSIWTDLINEPGAVRAILDLSGLQSGTHTLNVQVQVGLRPVQIVSISPRTVNLTLEPLASRELPINLVQRGTPAVGFLAEDPILSQTTVTVSGPESLVNKVKEVRAQLDINQASETINRTVNLQALDSNEASIGGLTLVPDRITVNQEISQRYGYRNVVVQVVVEGQVADGYRLTNISVFPPAVTVFSADPAVVSNLPGYVETVPININNANDDLDISLSLNLPDGVSVVGDQTSVLVRVGIAAIESSLTLPNVPVIFTNLPPGLGAVSSPETVTVILSGPVALLDRLKVEDVRVIVDLKDYVRGTYQVDPRVEVAIADLRVESILPENLEVVIGAASTPTKSTASP